MKKSMKDSKGRVVKSPMYFVNLNDSKGVDLADKKYKKQILRYGKWLYEDAPDGEFEVTPDNAKVLVDNFNKKTVENVPVTRGHVTQEEMDKNPKLIAGYVEELEIQDDGVYAVIKTADDDADEEIETKYKNVSVSIDSNYQDHETGSMMGWVMRHLALTTEPYIKALNPNFIALSDEYDKKIVSINLEDAEQDNKEEVKTEAKEEVKQEAKQEVKQEIKEEAKQEAGQEAKEEAKQEVEQEAKGEAKEEMKQEVKEEVKEEGKQETKEEVKETPEQMEARIRQTVKEEILKELEAKEKEEKTGTNTDGAEKDPKQSEVKMSENTKLSELEQSLKLAKSKIKTLELKELEGEVDDLIERGKVLPAQRDITLLLLRNKAVVNLAEGKSDNVANLFKSFLNNTLPQVDLSEKGVPPKTKETKDKPIGFLGIDPKEVDRLERKYPTRGMI